MLPQLLCPCGRLRAGGRALIRARLVLAEAGLEQATRSPAPGILFPCAGGAQLGPCPPWPLKRSLASPPRPFLDCLGQPGRLTSHPCSFLGLPTQPGLPASTGSCTLLSLTSPPSTGACVWLRLGACSAPALMGPPKASSMCLVRKVLAGAGAHPWGDRGGPQKPGPRPQCWL